MIDANIKQIADHFDDKGYVLVKARQLDNDEARCVVLVGESEG